MPLIFGAILSWFSSLAGRYLLDTSLRFIAQKILLTTLLTITFPIIVKNLLNWLMETLIAVVSTNVDTSGLSSTVVHFSGYAGYLASHLLLPDCISIILTAVAIRLVLNFIPFIG